MLSVIVMYSEWLFKVGVFAVSSYDETPVSFILFFFFLRSFFDIPSAFSLRGHEHCSKRLRSLVEGCFHCYNLAFHDSLLICPVASTWNMQGWSVLFLSVIYCWWFWDQLLCPLLLRPVLHIFLQYSCFAPVCFCFFVCLFLIFSFFPRNAFAVLLSMAGTLELEISQACLRSKSTYLSGRFFVGISSIYHVTY